MSEQPQADLKLPNPVELSETMTEIAEKSQKLVSEWLERQASDGRPPQLDPLNIGGAFLEMTARMMADPAKLVQAQMNLWQDYMNLWQTTTKRMLGDSAEPTASPERGDRRFKDPAWDDNQLFDFIKQSYLPRPIRRRWSKPR